MGGEVEQPYLPLSIGKVLEFLGGQLYNRSLIQSHLSVTPITREADKSSRGGWRWRNGGVSHEVPWSTKLPAKELCPWKHLHRGPSRKLAQGHNTSGQDHSSASYDALPALISLEVWNLGYILSHSKLLSKSDSSELHTHFYVLSIAVAGDVVCSTSIQITAGKSFAWRDRTGVKSLTE